MHKRPYERLLSAQVSLCVHVIAESFERRTTIEMKLWPTEQNFKLKLHPFVVPGNVQMTHIVSQVRDMIRP